MKKLLALLLAAVMAFGMCACNETGDDDHDYDIPVSIPDIVVTTPEQVNTDVYPLDTDITLRILFTEDGLGDTDASDLWETVVGVEIDNLKWNNQQMMNALSGGDIPDAIVMPWEFDKAMVYEFGEAGKFLDFSKYLDKMPNLCALIREYPEIMEVCSYPDGGMYSLPKVGWSNTYQSNLLYIRMDLLEKLGWEKAPQTADQFLEYIVAAQEKFGKDDPEFVAFMPSSNTYMEWTGNNTISATFFPCFGELIETGITVNADGEVVLGAASEQYRYYLEFMNEVWKSGAFETEVYTMDATAAKATIQGGHSAISIGTHVPKTLFGEYVEDVMQPLTSKYWAEKQWMKQPEVTYRGCVASAAAAEDPEKLDVLLKWLDSFYATEENPLAKDENGKATVYGASIVKGVLGEHWAMDHENKTWDSTNKTFTNYYDCLYSGAYVNYTPLANLYVKGKGTTENLLPYAKEVSGLKNAVLSQSDQDDYNDLWADLEKYISEQHAKFITGQEDLETGWDAYVTRLNQMGLEEVLEIYQKVYDGQNGK